MDHYQNEPADPGPESEIAKNSLSNWIDTFRFARFSKSASHQEREHIPTSVRSLHHFLQPGPHHHTGHHVEFDRPNTCTIRDLSLRLFTYRRAPSDLTGQLLCSVGEHHLTPPISDQERFVPQSNHEATASHYTAAAINTRVAQGICDLDFFHTCLHLEW